MNRPGYDEAVDAAQKAVRVEADSRDVVYAIDAAYPIIEAAVRNDESREAAKRSATECGKRQAEARADERRRIVKALREGNHPDDLVLYVRDALADAADFIEDKFADPKKQEGRTDA